MKENPWKVVVCDPTDKQLHIKSGTWTWSQLLCNTVVCSDEGLDKVSVAIVDGRSQAERETNANLIAAAPDMLAALEGFVEFWHDDSPFLIDQKIEAAKSAIKKARGQDQ